LARSGQANGGAGQGVAELSLAGSVIWSGNSVGSPFTIPTAQINFTGSTTIPAGATSLLSVTDWKKNPYVQGGTQSIIVSFASIGGFSALLLVISWWLVPVVGCIVTIPAVLVLYGIVAPEPIDIYLDGNFDRHSHARW
jgi:hypothetical protein